MSRYGKIRGEQIRDESVDSVDIASGSIKAGELSAEAISGQVLITSTDTTNDRLPDMGCHRFGSQKSVTLKPRTWRWWGLTSWI